MAVGRLLGGLDPGRKMRDIVIIRKKQKPGLGCLFDAEQQSASLDDGEPIGRSLHHYPDKSQFSD